MFKKNVGPLDRALRLVLAAVVVGAGLWLLDGRQGNPTGLLVAALALIPLLTGVLGFCPLYLPFRFSTRRD